MAWIGIAADLNAEGVVETEQDTAARCPPRPHRQSALRKILSADMLFAILAATAILLAILANRVKRTSLELAPPHLQAREGSSGAEAPTRSLPVPSGATEARPTKRTAPSPPKSRRNTGTKSRASEAKRRAGPPKPTRRKPTRSSKQHKSPAPATALPASGSAARATGKTRGKTKTAAASKGPRAKPPLNSPSPADRPPLSLEELRSLERKL